MHLDEIIRRLDKLDRAHDVVAGGEGPAASVAAIFRERPEGAELFFILRAERAGDPWSGHVAFPGGRRDPEDKTLLETAIRETREEVGIELALDHLIGRLPDVPAFSRTKRAGLVVTPFVFAVRGDFTVTPNDEVASTLWVPWDTLARGEGKGTYSFEYDGKMLVRPCIRLQPDQRVLWGMTYRMLETMIDALGE